MFMLCCLLWPLYESMPESKMHIGITTTYLVIYIFKFNMLDLVLKYYKMFGTHLIRI